MRDYSPMGSTGVWTGMPLSLPSWPSWLSPELLVAQWQGAGEPARAGAYAVRAAERALALRRRAAEQFLQCGRMEKG